VYRLKVELLVTRHSDLKYGAPLSSAKADSWRQISIMSAVELWCWHTARDIVRSTCTGKDEADKDGDDIAGMNKQHRERDTSPANV
jgi:hypothetical protein